MSSPSRVQPDDASSASAEDPKEKEDSEILRIYDGNNSLRNQVYRTASVPKTASVQLIRVSDFCLPILMAHQRSLICCTGRKAYMSGVYIEYW